MKLNETKWNNMFCFVFVLESGYQNIRLNPHFVFKIKVGQTLALSDAGKAHQAREHRQTIGSTVLLP